MATTAERSIEETQVHGFVKEGFEEVREVLRQNLEKETDLGSTFAAYYKGELVVNIWGGVVEKEAGMYWQEDTMPCFFSTTKSISAITVAHMVDRGLLDYGEKISKYWPEFAQNGKENITLETYMANRAGLSALDEPIELTWVKDNDIRLQNALAKQAPLWKPDTEFGYHPTTFAMYLDQIIRRVDQKERSLSQYFNDEIATPFGINFYVGLPLEMYYKAPRVKMMIEMTIEEMMKEFNSDKINQEILQKVLANPATKNGAGDWNSPYLRMQPIGSSCGHGTAEAVAKLHGIVANGGIQDGKTLLSTESIQRQLVVRSRGTGVALGLNGMFSLGTMVLAYRDGNSKPKYMFGHGGFGGQMATADPEYKVGIAYGTNHLHPILSTRPNGDRRWIDMHDALYRCVYKLENINVERHVFMSTAELDEYEKAL